MSSSNRVKIAAIKETVYGETPVAGNFSDCRYTSESLSGTPDTTESQQIRTDRQSSGQVVTGLEVGGDMNFELAKETPLEDFMSSAMFNAWDVQAPTTRDIEVDATAKKLIATTGSFITDGFKKGDFAKLSTMVETENNVRLLFKSVSALEIEYISENPLVDETKVNAVLTRYDKLTIGTTPTSFSMSKIFTDLTTKAINYLGMMVSGMSITAQYGELMTGNFTFAGNGYEAVDQAADMITDGRTINPPATTDTINGSIDMPLLATSATTGVLSADDLCIQTVSIELDNNFTDLTCIGKAAPENYDAGTAAISVSLSTYLKDSSWSLLPKKLTQEAFELAFAVLNAAGGYAFYMPALQASFDDPSSAGQNQQVSLELEGVAKVGPNGESALSIFRLTP